MLFRSKRFQEQARELLLDTKEFDDIQATALTALAQFGDEKVMEKDEKLLKRVNEFGKGKSAKMKKSAKAFMNKYGSDEK